MALSIKELQTLCKNDTFFMTRHVINRCHERLITKADIMNAIMNGEIIEQYPDDKPFQSCLILGTSTEYKSLHIVVSSSGDGIFIITAYWPCVDEWESDFKTRKER